MDYQRQIDQVINSNRSQIQKLINICEIIRDIPYARIGSLSPEKMLKVGKGSCTPKHIFLAQNLEKISISSKFLIMPFYYKKLKIDYPPGNEDLINKMPIAYHVALKINFNGKWINADVTWDSKLKGFPVNYNWNGKNNMKLAVVPEEIIEQSEDPKEFEKKKMKNYNDVELKIRKQFYKFFDSVLEKSRQ